MPALLSMVLCNSKISRIDGDGCFNTGLTGDRGACVYLQVGIHFRNSRVVGMPAQYGHFAFRPKLAEIQQRAANLPGNEKGCPIVVGRLALIPTSLSKWRSMG